MNTENPHSVSTVGDCRIVPLDKSGDLNGTLSVVQDGPDSPLGYDVRRVYYLYDIPAQASRGGHSHHGQYEFLIAVSGSFTVTLDDGREKRQHDLNRPDRGLLIAPGIWREINGFSSGAVCLVLSSGEYDEADYVRSYDDFLALTAEKR